MLSEVINEGFGPMVTSVTGVERSIAMDTAALLGGKEYLIEQVFKDSHSVTYTDSEKKCLEWALNFLWHPSLTYKDIRQNYMDLSGPYHVKGPADLLGLVVGYNTNRITRIVSTCLLYCSRYDDTEVYQNPEDNRQRILTINLERFPYLDFPFGEVPTSEGKKIPCKRMAIVYVKIDSRLQASTAPISRNVRRPVLDRKISFCGNIVSNEHERYKTVSHGLALETDMLENLHFVAMVPIP